ncbi:unnamed protein product [Diabrotica balteata]|uniref:Uncharacterized protein n=1 Tax=Diabrotica balteata TaxID=107213 RepID=A0A9N9T8P6_DIABA|nr:unnamed protein product [Diabrotica balteata]
MYKITDLILVGNTDNVGAKAYKYVDVDVEQKTLLFYNQQQLVIAYDTLVKAVNIGSGRINILDTLGGIGQIELFKSREDDVTTYLERIEQLFCNEVGDENKVPLFLTLMEKEAYKIIKDLTAPEVQESYENLTEFAEKLKSLSKDCSFGEFLDETLREFVQIALAKEVPEGQALLVGGDINKVGKVNFSGKKSNCQYKLNPLLRRTWLSILNLDWKNILQICQESEESNL